MKRTYGSLTVLQFPCLQDNYGFLLREEASGKVASVDTPDAKAIEKALESEGWHLDFILNTHWHPDHTGGNVALKKRFGAEIIGPAGEGDKIPGRERAVSNGDIVEIGEASARVLETPGHTMGHICYLFDDQKVGFVGDTLFSLGCGRLFEGTPGQMWASLSTLRALPDDMTLYCAHEYTAANARFADSLGEENPELAARIADITKLRAAGEPTVPMSLGTEKATNPFLRADAPSLQQAVGKTGDDPVDVFAEIRRRKDSF